MASSTHLSEYELTRQRNIERNMAFLKNIGLEASVNMRVQVSSNETNNQQVKASKQQKKLSETDGDNKILSNDLQDSSRRSTRIAAMNSIDYNVDNFQLSNSSNTESSSTSKKPRLEDSDIGYHTSFQNISQYISKPTSSSGTTIDPQSTRSLHANLSLFLGQNNICRPVSEFGKAAVVTMANNGVPPKFSKYSGVLEWKNCVFLWVNLGSGSVPDDDVEGSVGGRKLVESTYDNTFLNEGRSFVWFGGSKMTIDTPVIQRMLRIGATTANTSTEKTNTSSNSSSNVTSQANADNIISTTNQTDVINTDEEMVLLFARIIGEPYCCLGPLSLLNCNVDRHPLVFHWQLRAFDTLSCGPNTHQFKRILKVSPMS